MAELAERIGEHQEEAAEVAVTFLPMERDGACPTDQVLLESARDLGVRIASACGGRGRCRSCGVRIEGAVPEPADSDRGVFTPDQLAAGWRRACQVRPVGRCVVHVPVRAVAVAAARGQGGAATAVPIAEPVLLRREVEVAEGVDDVGALRAALGRSVAVDVGVLRGLGSSLRRHDGRVGVVLRGDEVVAVQAPGLPLLGLAVDLGTTNLAASLVDLVSGETLGFAAAENPQGVFGADVISRCVHAVRHGEGGAELRQAATAAIGRLAEELTGGAPERIVEVAVVGNTAMQHLLLGLPVERLARAPFLPVLADAIDLKARDLGLAIAPGAYVHVGPDIAGFVGSDHVAALLETMARRPDGVWAILDIGTNTEISLVRGGTVTSVSCASGPAFEGGSISCGMRAAPGAIEAATVAGRHLRLRTIDGEPPAGLCGSGVLSVMAGLRRCGAVDGRGRIGLGHPRVRERHGIREFVLASEDETGALPVTFSQGDVRAVQLAKAAIRAGLDVLLSEAGVAQAALDRVVVAGAFGRFIDLDAAVAIGLLPDLPRDRFAQVGNAAGDGARRMLACRRAREAARALAREASYLELASLPAFRDAFMKRMAL